MQLQTVSNISKTLGISNRMLRYYEQIGLVQSQHIDGYAYRVYDEAAVLRLRQIIVLRKLRVPVKHICEILGNDDAVQVIAVFERNISELDEEVTALSTVRSILNSLVNELRDKTSFQLRLDWLTDSSAVTLVDTLSFPKNTLQEERTMIELNKASERLSKLSDRDVRILYLPPATVAAAHYIGDDPEEQSGKMLHDFIKKADLASVYPAARCFGFNHPNPDMRDDGKYGYEFQVTIPDDMDVPAPLIKKRIVGGLYAAYMILMDEIAGIGWNRLFSSWLQGHEVWEGNMTPSGENMNGLLEEHLNILQWQMDGHLQQVDLLLPIKRKGK